jgi:putative salt-induced outer membrane protein
MSKYSCTAFLVAILLAPMTMADQIVLKNGDRLTGAIVKSDGKTLTIKAEFAGTVSVPLDAVTQITSDQPLYLTLKDNQTLVGTVGAADGKLLVRTSNAGNIAVSQDTIQTVRSKEEQEAYQIQLDRLRNPSLRDLWSGTVDTGLSLSRGNAETTTYNFGFNAARTTTRDKISTHMMALYARNSTTGASLVTANAKRGGARYDINLSSKVFAFGMGDLENDEFQKLDLRLMLGSGMGWHAKKTERTTFDVFGGGSLNREYFSTGLKRSSGEVLMGEELTHKLSARTSLRERAIFLPNMTETGEYRFNFDASAVTLLNTWLGWTVAFSDRYISNPVVGTKSNDILLSTGLRVTFGR